MPNTCGMSQETIDIKKNIVQKVYLQKFTKLLYNVRLICRYINIINTLTPARITEAHLMSHQTDCTAKYVVR